MSNTNLIKLLNTVDIRSNFSNYPVHFVSDDEYYTITGHMVVSDGINMIDNYENVEDDLSQMHCTLKDGSTMNYYDFCDENGMFDGDINGAINFVSAVATKLMSRREALIKKYN